LILGNFIGAAPDGTSATPNGIGIQIDASSSGNTIGGTSSAERNLIAGNQAHGLAIAGSGNVIQGNYIGHRGPQEAAASNGEDGLDVSGGTNTIGGTEPGAGNVISGNGA